MRTDRADPLEAFVDEGIRRMAKRGYYPTIFQGMRERHGTVEAIAKLVESGEIQSGFRKLQQLRMLDWSMEAAVMRFPERFSPAARECAEFRLRLAKQQTPEVR
jgi:hypothetical protein